MECQKKPTHRLVEAYELLWSQRLLRRRGDFDDGTTECHYELILGGPSLVVHELSQTISAAPGLPMVEAVVPPRTTKGKAEVNRAAIYARVSDKSQDGEDKTFIAEQIGDIEAYCESKALTITARYQEVGRGWSKKRPEFQRMLADAKKGRFDTIVCWKSDRLSRCMYPAAALMEVVEAHQIRLEAVMDVVDMKTFGLMGAIGKIELEDFRERSTMGKRGATKRGRAPTGGLLYGYRIGDDGSPRSQKSRPKLCAASFTCMFITLDVPIESEPATEDSVTVTLLEPSLCGSSWTCRKPITSTRRE